MKTICFLALGSNLDDPMLQVKTAIQEVDNLKNCQLLQQASLYKSASLINGQPDYINTVVKIETSLTAFELLDECKNIERVHQRVHYYKWGPRTLDIDILLYSDLHIETPKLLIPHPHMWQRDFVLLPLAEIEPTIKNPSGQLISKHVAQNKIVKI